MIFDEATCTALNAADEIRLDAEEKAAAMDEEYKAAKKAVEDSEESLFEALGGAREKFNGGVWDEDTCHSIDGIGADFERRKATYAVIDRKKRSLNDQAAKLGVRVFKLLAEARDHPLTAGQKGAPDPDAWCKVHVVNLLGELVADQLKKHGVISVADYLNLRRSILEKAVDDADLAEGVLAHADEVLKGYLQRRDRAGAWPKGLKTYSADPKALPTSGASGSGAPTATDTPAKSLPAGEAPDPGTSSSGSKTGKKSRRPDGLSAGGVPTWWTNGWRILAVEAELPLPSERYLVQLAEDTPAKLITVLIEGACTGRAPEDVRGPGRNLGMVLTVLQVNIAADLERGPLHPLIAKELARLVGNLGQRGMLNELWTVCPSLENTLALVPECDKEIGLSCTAEQAAASMGKQGAPAEINVSAPKKKRKKQEAAS